MKLTFIKATFDLTFLRSSLGLRRLPQAFVTAETDFKVLIDFFFFSFSGFSPFTASPDPQTLPPRAVLPSCTGPKL